MTWTTKHRNGTAALLASLALVSTGCSDEVTAPRGGARAPVVLGVRDEGLFVSNQVKYRNAGKPHATGRSGNATLEVRALRSKDNTTLLEITTGALDETAVAPGNLAKLQVKSLDPDNLSAALWVRNYNHRSGGGYASYVLASPGRGMPIQVQANITGIDARTDVVTVVETVKRRPDLAPSNLTAPVRARVNSPVTISATVRELNGDVGARASCVLYADGAEIDRLDGMWVDAAGSVSCAFAHTFTAVGTKALRAAVEGVVPGDWDEANNSTAGSVEIVGGNDFHYSASAFSDVEPWFLRYRHEFQTTTQDYTRSYSSTNQYFGVEQQAYLYAQMPKAVDFPLTGVELSQSTGGATVHSVSLSNVAPSWQYEDAQQRNACSYNYSDGPGGRVYWTICSSSYQPAGGTRSEWTDISYSRYAGDITYWSNGYDYTRWHASGDDNFYSWNITQEYNDQLVQYGSDFTFSVTLTDGGTLYRTNPTFALTRQSYEYSDPFRCYEYNDSYYYYYRDCYESYQRRTYVTGYKYGTPGSD